MMNHRLLQIVLTLLFVVSVVFVSIHFNVFGYKPSYEKNRQNFITNERYFQKTEDCFLEIVRCCSISDSTWEIIRFHIDDSHKNFVFDLFFPMENKWELLFPIKDSNVEICPEQQQILQSIGIDYQTVKKLYSNFKETNCCRIQRINGNNHVLFVMTYKQLDVYSINYMFYPQPIEADSIRPISNSSLGQRVIVSSW